jgi:hypothetical protein
LKHGVYVPDNNYFNCAPLPIEWLEILDSKKSLPEYIIKEEESQIGSDPLKKMYSVIKPTTSIKKFEQRSSLIKQRV